MDTVKNVRRAIVEAALANNIEDHEEIYLNASLAIKGISKGTVAAYKAHQTMRKKYRKSHCNSCYR